MSSNVSDMVSSQSPSVLITVDHCPVLSWGLITDPHPIFQRLALPKILNPSLITDSPLLLLPGMSKACDDWFSPKSERYRDMNYISVGPTVG